MKIIDNAGFKDLSRIQRLPIAKNDQGETVYGNAGLSLFNLHPKGKPVMDDDKALLLFNGADLVVEEKIDGHPKIVLHEGFTFFCEDLDIQHTVEYTDVPYSTGDWPDMLVVYDVIDGMLEPPYKGNEKPVWLNRENKEHICDLVGAPIVPIMWYGKVEPDQVPYLADELTQFGKDKAEGIVLKNYQTGVFGKFINLEFHEAITDEYLTSVHPLVRGKRNYRK